MTSARASEPLHRAWPLAHALGRAAHVVGVLATATPRADGRVFLGSRGAAGRVLLRRRQPERRHRAGANLVEHMPLRDLPAALRSADDGDRDVSQGSSHRLCKGDALGDADVQARQAAALPRLLLSRAGRAGRRARGRSTFAFRAAASRRLGSAVPPLVRPSTLSPLSFGPSRPPLHSSCSAARHAP